MFTPAFSSNWLERSLFPHFVLVLVKERLLSIWEGFLLERHEGRWLNGSVLFQVDL